MKLPTVSAAKYLATAAVVAGLSACAVYPSTSKPFRIQCERSGECDRIWAQAKAWLALNSTYRIQIANDNLIMTYGPFDSNGDAYTLLREKSATGPDRVIIYARCDATIYGCFEDPTPSAKQLYQALTHQQ